MIAENVPFRRVAGSRTLGIDDQGSTVREDDTGFVRPNHVVKVRDIFIDGAEAYQVESLVVSSTHLQSFKLARIVIR